jgi:hypothetical protein
MPDSPSSEGGKHENVICLIFFVVDVVDGFNKKRMT